MKPSENPAWLAVEGWCTPEEGDALYEQAKNTDGRIVEIGTGMGRSAIAMALSGVCINTIEYDFVRSATASSNAHRCGVIDRIQFIHANAQTVTEGSDPIAFLFIDGWHDAENVRADYHAWAPHVIPGGSIWFHDAYGAGWPDVHALIDELVASEALVLDGYVGTIAKCRKGAA
jgi:predicted O-methyltransferase YrrM